MAKIPQPRADEPIRLVSTSTGAVRYRVTLDAGRHPATGKRRQLTSTHPSLAAARRYVTKARADLDRGTFAVADRQTFADYAAAWLKRRRRKVRAITARSYAGCIRQADAAFGAKALTAITRADVEAVVERLASAGRSRRTAALTLFVIRAVLADALADGLLVRNVAAAVEPDGRDARPRDVLSGAELARLHEHLAADRLAALWMLTLYGLRRSEVMGLRWSDVDLDRGKLSIARGRVDVDGKRQDVGDPKTRRGTRTLPLPPDVLAALRALRKAQLAAFGGEQVRTGWLAVDEVGVPIRPERWSDYWHEHVEAAGIDAGERKLTLHCARHSSVTAMLDAGVPLRIVAAWHGHDPAVAARTYDHADKNTDALASAASALSSVYSASS
jgi:integrase